MKIKVEIIDDIEDIIENGVSPTCLVDINDEKGHVIQEIQIQPIFERSGEVTALYSNGCIDDLTLKYDGEKYISCDLEKEFSSDIVPIFYDIDENDNAEIKEDLKEQLIDAINKALFQYYNADDDEPISDDYAHEISCARGKAFLRKYHYVVAYHLHGQLAKNSKGWDFKTFANKEDAIEFKDDFLANNMFNPNCFAELYGPDDYEEIGDFLEYNSIVKIHNFCHE